MIEEVLTLAKEITEDNIHELFNKLKDTDPNYMMVMELFLFHQPSMLKYI